MQSLCSCIGHTHCFIIIIIIIIIKLLSSSLLLLLRIMRSLKHLETHGDISRAFKSSRWLMKNRSGIFVRRWRPVHTLYDAFQLSFASSDAGGSNYSVTPGCDMHLYCRQRNIFWRWQINYCRPITRSTCRSKTSSAYFRRWVYIKIFLKTKTQLV